MAAWSFYEANEYNRAVVALERFIELNPTDPLIGLRILPQSGNAFTTNCRCRT